MLEQRCAKDGLRFSHRIHLRESGNLEFDHDPIPDGHELYIRRKEHWVSKTHPGLEAVVEKVEGGYVYFHFSHLPHVTARNEIYLFEKTYKRKKK